MKTAQISLGTRFGPNDLQNSEVELDSTVMVFHRFYIRGFFVHYTLYNLKLDMHPVGELCVPKKSRKLREMESEKKQIMGNKFAGVRVVIFFTL